MVLGWRSGAGKREASVSLFGQEVPLKWVSLVVLIVQNTVLVLAMRISRTSGGELYVASTAVVCAEVVKLVISLICLRGELQENFLSYVMEEVFSSDTLLLAVPGLLYTVQNNLLFVALSNLQAAVYQVTYQLKIITTALMSRLLLGKSLNQNQTASLGLLTVGVALVQLANTSSSGQGPSTGQRPMLGLGCVLIACMTSGFAGVYTEKVIKHGRQVSLFTRNIQLALFGILLGLAGVLVSDLEQVSRNGFFHGYNAMVWFVILTQAGGGLMIAVVMKYADNILKGFATSISIVLSSYLSTMLFDFSLSFLFVVGASIVIGAVFLYGTPPRQRAISSDRERVVLNKGRIAPDDSPKSAGYSRSHVTV